MKNIIIVGASRSGKSTLAKQITSMLNISHFPFDAFVSTLEELYPQIGIKHVDDNIDMSRKISRLLRVFVKHMEYEESRYLIDLYQVYPEDLKEILNQDFVILYLGYPFVEIKDKLKQIKQHARKIDWTNDVSDEEMIEIITLFQNENKIMYEQCKKLGIPFFDTSTNFEKVIEDALQYIVRNV